MANITLNAQVREEAGKNRVDKLRQAGVVPAVVYQKDEEPASVKVNAREFNRVYTEAGTSALVDLVIDGAKRTVLIKEVQRHPYRNEVLHVDFMGVRMDEAIKVMIPVVLLHRDEIRLQPSVLIQMMDEVEIESLPADIPAQAEVDVENMQYGDVLTVGDLDVASNEKVTVLTEATEPVASLSEPQAEVAEEEETETDAADVPEIGKEESEEE